ncbi:hypothetical protein Tco_0545671 [Tanacetum coccineum]
MSRLMHLEELCVAANLRFLASAMLVYFQRDTTRDMQYATDITKLWQELAAHVNKRDIFIGTDNAKITRKRSKPDKHEHENG